LGGHTPQPPGHFATRPSCESLLVEASGVASAAAASRATASSARVPIARGSGSGYTLGRGSK
jgi:hypothetical protein